MSSEFGPRYDKVIDRESAYEKLQKRVEQAAKEAEQATLDKNRVYKAPASQSKKLPQARRSSRQGVFETMAKSVARTMGREVTRGVSCGGCWGPCSRDVNS